MALEVVENEMKIVMHGEHTFAAMIEEMGGKPTRRWPIMDTMLFGLVET